MDIRNIEVTAPARQGAPPKQTWFAAGGVIGAVLASSCCIAPLVLLTLGVSGAWIGNLTALEPYKPVFLGVALRIHWARFSSGLFQAESACEDGSYCARPESTIVTKTALWVATLLVVLAASIDGWAPLFY